MNLAIFITQVRIAGEVFEIRDQMSRSWQGQMHFSQFTVVRLLSVQQRHTNRQIRRCGARLFSNMI